jgi:predicted  nucleic acid-binding Zn-ribbon protein
MTHGTTQERVIQENKILKEKVNDLESDLRKANSKIESLEDQLKYCSCQYESMKLFKD